MPNMSALSAFHNDENVKAFTVNPLSAFPDIQGIPSAETGQDVPQAGAGDASKHHARRSRRSRRSSPEHERLDEHLAPDDATPPEKPGDRSPADAPRESFGVKVVQIDYSLPVGERYARMWEDA